MFGKRRAGVSSAEEANVITLHVFGPNLGLPDASPSA